MRGSEFAELTAFAAVVEHHSFSRAAAHLGVTPSALSQTLRALEGRLGVRLINRTTRSVAPTQAGAKLAERLAPLLSELDASIHDVKSARNAQSGLLRINMPRLACEYFITPLLGEFARAYPEIVLDIIIDDALTDIVAGRFDAGIRLGERLAQDVVAVKLGGELELMAVATPGYLAEHGIPATPNDLHQHRCINVRMPTSGAIYKWEFQKGRREFEVAVAGPLIVNDSTTAVHAAVDGVGIAYTFDLQVQRFIAAGKLKRVLEAWSPRFPGMYLYYPGRRQPPPTLKAFIDFVRKHVRS